ncbi:biopolymer transporter ExbD [Dyadobacter sp. 676]|uniref:Biopolymer transporter ExbD n=1 Tax=Dyadobacter sp. 676 TaxID=3088362 RepID=A0AAU8FJN5_9BACT
MATIEAPASNRGYGKAKNNRMSTRVDMTPMVDLGFLLITFFMLATTMSKPTVMSVFFPDKTKEKTIEETQPIPASLTLTLFLGSHDEIYYLDGIAPDATNASPSLKTVRPGYELRNVIFNAQKRVAALPRKQNGEDRSLVVVIKPTAVSTYRNMVDVMDEMAITKSKRYALVDKLTGAEAKLLGDRILKSK